MKFSLVFIAAAAAVGAQAQVDGAYANSTAPLTVTEVAHVNSTVATVTITSCDDHKCHEIPATLVTTVTHGVTVTLTVPCETTTASQLGSVSPAPKPAPKPTTEASVAPKPAPETPSPAPAPKPTTAPAPAPVPESSSTLTLAKTLTQTLTKPHNLTIPTTPVQVPTTTVEQANAAVQQHANVVIAAVLGAAALLM